jgi:mono/diheme cytochrome c family protein
VNARPIATILGVLLIAGCAKGSESTTATTTAAAPAANAPVARPAIEAISGDAVHGKMIFAANCVQCHGVAGAGTKGGVFPVLVGERKKKNMATTVAWIKNPQPPMPKYYPGTLSEKDVVDVAAYVQSL